jgi:hypothetical protein
MRSLSRPLTIIALTASLSAVIITAGSPARAFNEDNHSKITKAALYSWDAKTLKEMVDAKNGAVVADDHAPYAQFGPLHCDNADYVGPRFADHYPRTRDDANAEFVACVAGAVSRFKKAVTYANDLVDASGKVIPSAVDLSKPCQWDDQLGRAKCNVLEQLGRGWHPIEDFYAHSNWTDQSGPGPIGVDNPYGLRETTLPDFFEIRRFSRLSQPDWVAQVISAIPPDLATGCIPGYFESTGARADCAGRITHATLNKDSASTSRSKWGDNFAHAIAFATKDVQRQWHDFQDELLTQYPKNQRGRAMICAIIHDDPVRSC